MVKNVGGIDKIIRVVLGIILVIVGLFTPLSPGLRTGAIIVGIIALFTGFFGF